jgi:cytochrome P450 family 710 subfamily A protein
VRPDLAATITGDVLNQMTYSRQVVKEVLRFRPPAPMVPQVSPAPHLATTGLRIKADTCQRQGA